MGCPGDSLTCVENFSEGHVSVSQLFGSWASPWECVKSAASTVVNTVTSVATSTVNFVEQHPTETLLIALGVVAVVGFGILTLGAGDVIIGALLGADTATLLGAFELADLAVHAPFVLGISLLAVGAGVYLIYKGIHSAQTGSLTAGGC